MNTDIEQIARTEDTNDPVYRASYGDSEMTFIFPTEEPHDIWVHTVRSRESGGMSAMLDYVCAKYDCQTIRFVNVLNENIEEKLDGATVVTETVPEPSPYAGEQITCVDVEWQI